MRYIRAVLVCRYGESIQEDVKIELLHTELSWVQCFSSRPAVVTYWKERV
ncbi:hypothetical protein [Coleofasciculus sp. E2-BRE-01]